MKQSLSKYKNSRLFDKKKQVQNYLRTNATVLVEKNGNFGLHTKRSKL